MPAAMSLEEFIQTLEDLAAELTGALNWDTPAEDARRSFSNRVCVSAA